MIQNVITETYDPAGGADHRLEVSVAGLPCAGEAAPLARRLEHLPGVLEALINPITERAVIRFDPAITDVEEVFAMLGTLGVDGADRLVRRHAPAPGCTCPGCSERLKARLAGIEGVEAVIVNAGEKSVTLEYVPSRTDAALVTRVLAVSDTKVCDSEA